MTDQHTEAPAPAADPLPSPPGPPGGPGAPTAPATRRRVRGLPRDAWTYGLGGLCFGLAAGLVFGSLASPTADGANAASETASSGDPASAGQPMEDAVETCGVAGTTGIELLDGGRSIQVNTAGAESTGAAYTDVMCVLTELGIPESTVSRMESTRALDGRQDATWANYSATWGYHPDDGLDVVVETTTEES